MKKKVIAMFAIVLCLVMGLCACSSSTTQQKVTIKLDGHTMVLKTTDDYILQTYDESNGLSKNGFAVFYNDDNKENFAIGLIFDNPNNETFEFFKQSTITDSSIKEVYESTDNFIYYCVVNEDDSSKLEYNRVIKLDNGCVLYLGSFDKAAVDTFYKAFTFEIRN